MDPNVEIKGMIEDNKEYAPDSFSSIEDAFIGSAFKAGQNDLERALLVRQALLVLKNKYGKLTKSGDNLLISLTPREMHDEEGIRMEDAYLNEEKQVSYKSR